MKRSALVLTSLLTSTTLLFGLARPASAEVSMVVSPPSYSLEVKPGDVIQKTVKVTNPSEDSSLVLSATVSDFVVLDDAGTPTKVDVSASGRYLASPWFTLDTSSFTLGPKETSQVNVVIKVPADALPGGHYAGVFFEPVVDKKLNDSAAYTSAQVGSLFGLTIEGNIKFDAIIKDFSSTQGIYEFGPVGFSATVENQSDTHIRPNTSIIIKDMFGRTLETLSLDEVNIFPFASRNFEAEWETVWGLGRYTASIVASYGPGLTAERTIFFWIMPWRVIIAILIILAVIIVIYISVRRHLAHKYDTRDNEIDELKRRIVELENQK